MTWDEVKRVWTQGRKSAIKTTWAVVNSWVKQTPDRQSESA